MDILKKELVKKRQSLFEETSGRKVFKRSEIEQKRIQKRLEDEKQDKRLCEYLNLLNPIDSTEYKPESSSISPPKQEVIRPPRFLKQPVTSLGMEQDTNNFKHMKTNICELSCDEDKILVFLSKLLIERNHVLEEMTESDKRTAKGKSAFATFKQCKRDLNPLFNLCRNKVCFVY
ncbi:putative pre-mRNA-splicing factor 18 [Helianthus debilis subsp. tardiflorus]